MLKIYHMPRSRSARPIWVAEELGLPYEVILKQRAELKLPDFIAINPLGNAPAIQDDGVTMHESCGIVAYLVDRYDTANRLAPPSASPARGAYQQWLHFAEASFWPLIAAHIGASGRFWGTADEAATAAATARISNVLNYIDNTLAAQSHIAGEDFSAADIALAWVLVIGKWLDAIDDRETANVRAYTARIGSRPAFAKAMEIPEGWENQLPGTVHTPPILRIS